MAQSGEAFNQVRDILAKLDRSIDRARAKRISGDNAEDQEGQTPTAGPGGTLRARPLRRPETDDNDPGGKWIGRSDA